MESVSKCNICSTEAKGGATRWSSQLLGRAVGQARKANIAACKGGPTPQSKAMLKEAKQLLNEYTHTAEAKKTEKAENERAFSELQWRENMAAEMAAAGASTVTESSSQQQKSSLVQPKPFFSDLVWYTDMHMRISGRISGRICHTLPSCTGTHTLPGVFLAYLRTLNSCGASLMISRGVGSCSAISPAWQQDES